MKYFYKYKSPIGIIIATCNNSALTGLWFENQNNCGVIDACDIEITKVAHVTVLEDTKRWLDMYFSGKEPDFTPQLFLLTTTFREKVCEIMMTIPYGSIITYAEIAQVINLERRGKNKNTVLYDQGEESGSRTSPRAVGGAVGHNPVSLIVPCHRVIGSDAELTGYAGGLERKKYLLELEGFEIEGTCVLRKS